MYDDIPKEITLQHNITTDKMIKSIIDYITNERKHFNQKYITLPIFPVNITKLLKILKDRNLKCEIVDTYIMKKYVGNDYYGEYYDEWVGGSKYYYKPKSINEFNYNGFKDSIISVTHKVFFTKKVNQFKLLDEPCGKAIEVNCDDMHIHKKYSKERYCPECDEVITKKVFGRDDKYCPWCGQNILIYTDDEKENNDE